MMESEIERRKSEHLKVCLEDEVESGASPGFSGYRLDYRALPEVNFDDVDLSTTLCGKKLAGPLMIGAMTGGSTRAGAVNRILAEAAERCGVAFALGSGRAALEHSELEETFNVRDVAPNALIFANLGAVQLNYGVTPEDAARLVKICGANALNLHLNALQEAVQEGGDTNFANLCEKISAVAETLNSPVFVKEVGAGLDARSANALAALPIEGLETAGLGGTSWARVEAYRSKNRSIRYAGFELGDVGVPTADSIVMCRAALGSTRTVVGSGGIRRASDMAMALALGADIVACALPFLQVAEDGVDAVVARIEEMLYALRVACFVCGAINPKGLQGRYVRRGQIDEHH